MTCYGNFDGPFDDINKAFEICNARSGCTAVRDIDCKEDNFYTCNANIEHMQHSCIYEKGKMVRPVSYLTLLQGVYNGIDI